MLEMACALFSLLTLFHDRRANIVLATLCKQSGMMMITMMLMMIAPGFFLLTAAYMQTICYHTPPCTAHELTLSVIYKSTYGFVMCMFLCLCVLFQFVRTFGGENDLRV